MVGLSYWKLLLSVFPCAGLNVKATARYTDKHYHLEFPISADPGILLCFVLTLRLLWEASDLAKHL